MTKSNISAAWRVYLVRCSDNSLYCGITQNIEQRIRAHNEGKGAKYTRGRGPVMLAAVSPNMSKADALRLEILIKKQPAAKKLKTLKKGSVK